VPVLPLQWSRFGVEEWWWAGLVVLLRRRRTRTGLLCMDGSVRAHPQIQGRSYVQSVVSWDTHVFLSALVLL
jgi:hypothetical protein